jgi:hypothetical protein
MSAEILNLAPYFRNGRLYFPETTINTLLQFGLDDETSSKALQGLSLDDSQSLAELSQAIDFLLMQVDSTSPFFSALTSDDAYFVLTGKPLSA